MKKAIAIILVLLLVGGGFMFTRFLQKNKEPTLESLKAKAPKYENLRGLHYYHGGGMEGTSHRMEVKADEEGRTIVSYEDSFSWNFPARIRIYEADPSLLQVLEDYVREYNLSVWDELPESEYEVLDAPSTSLSLYFAVPDQKYQESITIDYDDEFPEGGYDVLNRFIKLIGEAVQSGNLIETFLEDRDGNRIYTGRDIENSDEEIEQLLTGYWQNGEDRIYFYRPDDITVIGFGRDRRDFEVKEIVNEPYGENDASWYAVLVNREDEDDRLILTIDAYRLFVSDEKDCSLMMEQL